MVAAKSVTQEPQTKARGYVGAQLICAALSTESSKRQHVFPRRQLQPLLVYLKRCIPQWTKIKARPHSRIVFPPEEKAVWMSFPRPPKPKT